MPAFRLYGQTGCPHCSGAAERFKNAGIPFEEIEIAGDPIIEAGLRAITQQLVYTVPVIVSFLTGHVILGNKPEEINHVINLYRSSVGAVAPNPAPNAG